MLKNTTERFGSVAKFFHWVITLAIIAQIYLITHRSYMPKEDPWKMTYMLLHKSVGMSILFLGICFIIWHFLNPKPRYPSGMPRHASTAARTVHGLLFLIMLAMPLSGYIMSVAGGYKVSWFGLFTWPALLEKSKATGSIAHDAHEYIAYVLFVLLIGHVGASLYHHYVKKDTVLIRMLPFRKRI